ncbi:MAG: hypothetical protein HFJ75_10525 [Eggerthellaceae bacterium]|nr:hypothetical protein [Eggerthellaceae bacterium]
MSKKHTTHPVPRVDERALRASEKAHSRDVLANDQPVVLESSGDDPEFPAMQEFEVDTDGPKGSAAKHPGLVWGALAVVAVAVLCVAFAAAGDWFTPGQAERTAQTEFEEQTVPEDLGANEDPAAEAQADAAAK